MKEKINSSFEKLRNLKFVIPATLGLFLASCENKESRSEIISKAIENDHLGRVEYVEKDKLKKAKEIFDRFYLKNSEVALKTDLFDVYAINDSSVEIRKFPNKTIDYIFKKDGTTVLIWGEDKDLMSGDIVNLNDGQLVVDNETGVIIYYNEADISGEPEYKISSSGNIEYRHGRFESFYKKDRAKNVLNSNLDDFEIIEKQLNIENK